MMRRWPEYQKSQSHYLTDRESFALNADCYQPRANPRSQYDFEMIRLLLDEYESYRVEVGFRQKRYSEIGSCQKSILAIVTVTAVDQP